MADFAFPKRPFKICNSERGEKKGIVCSSLDELRSISQEQFSLNDHCRVFLESDGTEVDNDEYFQFLPPQTLFMVTEATGQWVRESSDSLGSQMKIDYLSESQESFQGEDQIDGGVQLSSSLRQRILEDPVFFVSLSTEELYTIVDFEIKELQSQLRCPESKVKFYQESCQQEIDRRTDIKETTELLRICQKAISRRREEQDELQQSKKQKT